MGGSMRDTVVLILYSILSTVATWDTTPKSLCREEEREALLSFKNGLRDPSNRLSSWGSGGDDHRDCCRWAGVHCHNTTGHVLRLNLRQQNDQPAHAPFTGVISTSLLQLKHLRYLDLSRNDFEGIPLPEFFGSLSNLRYLNLSETGFAGAIPRQLGNLSKLHYLDLRRCYYLSAGQDFGWISGLTSLEYLDMTEVNLSNASNWLQVMNKFHFLSVLRLSFCELRTTDDPLPHVNFSSLTILDLSRNHFFSSSFDWFASMKSLVGLKLASCGIHGPIPSSLGNMTSLGFLDLSNNNLISPFPDSLYRVTSLKHLNLGSNNFHGEFPNDVLNLTSLNYLDLSNNALEGDILRSVGKLCAFQLSSCRGQGKSLEFLNLGRNKLTGSFPETLGESCKSLKVLKLGTNQLSGGIPISLGGIWPLRLLDIGDNFFEGIVSEEHLANLTNLVELEAPSNQLTFQFSSNWNPPFRLSKLNLGSCFVGPQFPAWLQTQKSLITVCMPNAGIKGCIPAWFWSPFHMFIDLSHNQITGSIPSLITAYINLGSNNFTGPLPQILPSVFVLDLSNNSFHGSLSRMMCPWRIDIKAGGFLQPLDVSGGSLQSLDVSGNLLSGELPDCWMNWTLLTKLNLGNNNLTGHLPTSMGSLVSLGSLLLHNNHLSGSFPLPLKNCSGLALLDLSGNEFSGSIPPWIGNFSGRSIETIPSYVQVRDDGQSTHKSGFAVLVLHSNKFSGSIPLELCQLGSLQILDLGNNNLSGTIPRCFGELISMIEPSNSSWFNFYGDFAFQPQPSIPATLVVKGAEQEYKENLGLVVGLDLSDNQLTGEIPGELTRLHAVLFLNLSNNHLQGGIPGKIGAMASLESLDLSMNRLSGVIPQGIADISFLGYLNLSYNNLCGQIPLGTQIQGFTPLSFMGNPELCGAPLARTCREDDKQNLENDDDDDTEDDGWMDMKWFSLGTPWGFVVGFWAILAPLALNRKWRYAYFQFLDEMKYKLLELGWCL